MPKDFEPSKGELNISSTWFLFEDPYRIDHFTAKKSLPNKSGFEVCKLLKQDPATKAIPIIMITGMGKMSDAEKAFSAGADAYVIKPIEPARLMKKLGEVLPKAFGA